MLSEQKSLKLINLIKLSKLEIHQIWIQLLQTMKIDNKEKHKKLK